MVVADLPCDFSRAAGLVHGRRVPGEGLENLGTLVTRPDPWACSPDMPFVNRWLAAERRR